MKQVYLLYSGNAWLNNTSLKLLAVCSTKTKAIQLSEEDAMDTDEHLTDYDLKTLFEINQTYSRDCNYLICQTDVDTL